MKQQVKLTKATWEVDFNAPIAPSGGFGEVFYGVGDKEKVAIKRLKISAEEAAHREMRIGEFLLDRAFKNIVPVLDVGQDANSNRYYLVMPVCQKSLQSEIEERKVFSSDDAIRVLLDILNGLDEAKDLTHRDIKPSNILLHDGVWKIADFGISKFVAESTSLRTLKEGLTPLYAAPEQWELKASSGATDIYAVGCIAHTLATGSPPFSGTADQLREKHLSVSPASVGAYPQAVQSLINLTLRKSPDVRPSRGRCIQVLNTALVPTERKSNPHLESAVVAATAAQATRDAARKAESERQEAQKRIFDAAVQEISGIRSGMFKIIREAAHGALQRNTDAEINMELACLEFNTSLGSTGRNGIKNCAAEMHGNAWGVHPKTSQWDFIAEGRISVTQNSSTRRVRSANLIFGRPNQESDYRWWEMTFFSPWSASQKVAPFSEDYIWEIDKALGGGMHTIQLAHQPKAIDGEDAEAFIEYWIRIFGQASTGSLPVISSFPFSR